MSKVLIAKCGLDCFECDAYLTTQNNDLPALAKMSEHANQQFGMTLTWEDSQCDGCMSSGRQFGFCSQCKVRLCAIEHNLENCAHCPEFGCTTITEFLAMLPVQKPNWMPSISLCINPPFSSKITPLG
jgi:hypothetical protein